MPIVSAVAVSGSVGSGGIKTGLGKIVEAAMSQAVLDCQKEGITDPAKIRERMQTARRRVVAGAV